MKTYPSVDWRQVVCERGKGGQRDGWGGCDQGSDHRQTAPCSTRTMDLGMIWALLGTVGRLQRER